MSDGLTNRSEELSSVLLSLVYSLNEHGGGVVTHNTKYIDKAF